MTLFKLDYEEQRPGKPLGPVTLRGEEGGPTPVIGLSVVGEPKVKVGVDVTDKPLAVDVALRDIGLRPATVTLKLCGLFTILTMEVGP